MGCNCSREASKVIVNRQITYKNRFMIKIHIPESDRVKIIPFEGCTDYMLFTELMNLAFFCSRYADELDANFISVFNKQKDEFDYYIQRLFGYELEKEDLPNLGKMWKPYINGVKMNLSELCGKNRVLKKDDEIELKYEQNIIMPLETLIE